MNVTELVAKLKKKLEAELLSMAEPGYDEFVKYRESHARYHSLRAQLALLKTTIDEEDDKAS